MSQTIADKRFEQGLSALKFLLAHAHETAEFCQTVTLATGHCGDCLKCRVAIAVTMLIAANIAPDKNIEAAHEAATGLLASFANAPLPKHRTAPVKEES